MANANGSIDEIIGKQAYKQIEDLKLQLAELEQSFVSTAKAASSLMSVDINKNGGSIKAVNQTLSETDKAVSKLNKTMNQYGSDVVKFNLLQKQQAEANKNNAKETLYAQGSYKQLEAQMATLIARYKTMNAEMRNSAFGKEMASNIAKINTELKALDSSLGNNQRNVGNYAGALSKVWSGLRQIAYIVPGLGIAGIFNLAGEAIAKVFPQIGEFYDKLVNGNKEAQKAAKELSEDIGKQTGKFESLTRQLNDNNLSRQEHIKAAKELKELYPTALKNYSLEEIAAGKAASAINLIKDALIAVSMARAAQADMDKAAGEKYANEKRIDELKAKLVLEKENQKVLLEQTKTINKNDNYYNLVVERANMSTQAISSMSSEIDNLTNRNLVLENSMNKTANAIGRYNTSATAGGLNLEGQDLSKGQKKNKEGKTRVQLLEEEYKDEIQKSDIFSTQLSESENVAFLRRLQITQKYIDEKLSKLDNLNKEEEKQLLDFQSELYKVIKANLDKRNKAEADALKQTLQDLKDEADKRKELAKEQQDLNKKTADLEKQDNKDSADRAEAAIRNIGKETEALKEKEKALQDLRQVISDSSLSIIESVGGYLLQQEIAQIEKKGKLIDEQYKNELRFIEQSGLSAKQKERQRQELEAETEAKRKKNDRERIDALRKQAKFQKALDIATIISNTAIAITSHMKLNPPLNAIAIASDIAIGAANLAKVIATPLPQYAKGRKGGKAEWAIVGEEGTEGIRTPDGKMTLTPNKPTVTFLPKDAEVIPHHEMIKNAAFVHLAKQSQVTVDKYQQALIDKFEEELEELRGIKSAILNKEFGNSMNVYKGFEQYKNTNIR